VIGRTLPRICADDRGLQKARVWQTSMNLRLGSNLTLPHCLS
jgi:hypothetical protein